MKHLAALREKPSLIVGDFDSHENPHLDGEITCEYQYGVSNEVIPGKTAIVSVREGKLLLIKDR